MKYVAVMMFVLFASPLRGSDVVTVLEKPDKATLRDIVIARSYDGEIVAASEWLIPKLADREWSNSSVRIYVANLLLEKAPLSASQAVDLATCLLVERSKYDVDCLNPLLMQLIHCLPAEADPADITKRLNAKGWHRPFSDHPISLETVDQHLRFVNGHRQNIHGRGPSAIPFPFPFTSLDLKSPRRTL